MSNPVTNKTSFQLQTDDWMSWLDHCRLVKELTDQLAAKDLEIAKLQPDYVEPVPPTVANKVYDAVLSALTEDEVLTYSKEIDAIKIDLVAAEAAVKSGGGKVVVEEPVEV